jgi:dienelactone hydrolase
MSKAGVDWQVVLFGDAVHSFTVPSAGSDKSMGMAYNEKADKRSWAMLLDFFNQIFS